MKPQSVDPAPTHFDLIVAKVKAYYKKMNRIADFLEKNAPKDLQIDRTKEYLQFYIDKEALNRLNKLAALPGCDSLVVFHALTDYVGGNGVTGCVLAVNAKREILDDHFNTKKNPAEFGEDTWLPPGGTTGTGVVVAYVPSNNDFNLATETTKVDNHFKR